MTNGAQGIHHSSGATSIYAKAQERKDVDASAVYQDELKKGNVFDFAQKYLEQRSFLTTAQTGGGTIW